jgi:nitric oxide reductase NorQ protein
VVACNEDTTAADLVGRYLLNGSTTEWQDGPATRAARIGALLYLDELAEAREDVLVVLHALADHRRELYLDRRNETLKAAPRFYLAASFNPGYQARSRDLKPSTRQRFVTVACGFPDPAGESQIIAAEAGVAEGIAKPLAQLAATIRAATDLPLRETVSTRSLIYAARLVKAGMSLRAAATAAIAETLTDEVDLTSALRDLINLKL